MTKARQGLIHRNWFRIFHFSVLFHVGFVHLTIRSYSIYKFSLKLKQVEFVQRKGFIAAHGSICFFADHLTKRFQISCLCCEYYENCIAYHLRHQSFQINGNWKLGAMYQSLSYVRYIRDISYHKLF